MKNSKHSILGSLTLAILFLLTCPSQSNAAQKSKDASNTIRKERLVLMPIRVPDDDKNLTGAMETALVEGLQQKYDVFSGEQVSQKAHQIFMKESQNLAHKECDETRCMQNIAVAFQAELIATANVTKQDGSYFLALSIQNIFDDKVVYSKSMPCENCKAVQVITGLKLISGAISADSLSTTRPKEQSNQSMNDADSALWTVAQRRNKFEDYQLYIDTYPTGKYVSLAKSSMERLKSNGSVSGRVMVANYDDRDRPNQNVVNFKLCHDDTQRLCQGVTPGGGRIIECLKSKSSSLSSECATALENMEIRKHQNREARPMGGKLRNCKEDVAKLCRGVKSGGGRIIACLKSNEEVLSMACLTALNRN